LLAHVPRAEALRYVQAFLRDEFTAAGTAELLTGKLFSSAL
jgi:hypothetical protein